MKYKETLLEQLKSIPHFDKKIIYQLSEQYHTKKPTVDTNINRSLKRGELVQLKKGFYISSDYYERNQEDVSYLFYLANLLRSPSYISSWTALQYYDLCTEAIHSIISVTPRVTRNYVTKAGHFSYHTVKRDLFFGFSLLKRNFNFYIATPPKALFDLLYLKTSQFRGISIRKIPIILEQLRIDEGAMDQKDRSQFNNLLRNYFKSNG